MSIAACGASPVLCANQAAVVVGDLIAGEALGGATLTGAGVGVTILTKAEAEAEAIKLIAQRAVTAEISATKAGQRDLAYVLHQIELGMDPDKKKYVIDEAITGIRLEASIGKRLERKLGGGGDWVSSAGVVYDAASPVPSQFFNASTFSAWKESVQSHFLKQGVDIVVVDIAQRGLTPTQAAMVMDYIHSLPLSQQKKILVLN
jgi:hypothetical protein